MTDRVISMSEAELLDPINVLIVEYAEWNKANGLNLGSADEHCMDAGLTDAQKDYLCDFCDRWDAALAAENIRNVYPDPDKRTLELDIMQSRGEI